MSKVSTVRYPNERAGWAAEPGWAAELELSLARRGAVTVLERNRHQGPLLVQKALYPEGPSVCHLAILHPPGGIAAGDRLSVRASVGEAAHALLTTPGATKWYRSEGASAAQTVHFSIGRRASVEWLPRENIFFDGANISMELDVDLEPEANYFGWDIFCFGRRASGETWRRGRLRMQTRIRCGQRPLWSEIADLEAQSGFAASAVGLAGFTVCGTFVLSGAAVTAQWLARSRELQPPPASRVGLTQLPQVLIARYLGNSSEDAFRWFSALWTLLRPAALDRAACPPRVWAC